MAERPSKMPGVHNHIESAPIEFVKILRWIKRKISSDKVNPRTSEHKEGNLENLSEIIQIACKELPKIIVKPHELNLGPQQVTMKQTESRLDHLELFKRHQRDQCDLFKTVLFRKVNHFKMTVFTEIKIWCCIWIKIILILVLYNKLSSSYVICLFKNLNNFSVFFLDLFYWTRHAMKHTINLLWKKANFFPKFSATFTSIKFFNLNKFVLKQKNNRKLAPCYPCLVNNPHVGGCSRFVLLLHGKCFWMTHCYVKKTQTLPNFIIPSNQRH